MGGFGGHTLKIDPSILNGRDHLIPHAQGHNGVLSGGRGALPQYLFIAFVVLYQYFTFVLSLKVFFFFFSKW